MLSPDLVTAHVTLRCDAVKGARTAAALGRCAQMACDPEALRRAARQGDLARLRALLPLCGDPAEDLADAEGITPLMLAAAGGHEAVVEFLLRCGADASARDRLGRSAARHARLGGHPHLAERIDTVLDQDKTIW